MQRSAETERNDAALCRKRAERCREGVRRPCEGLILLSRCIISLYFGSRSGEKRPWDMFQDVSQDAPRDMPQDARNKEDAWCSPVLLDSFDFGARIDRHPYKGPTGFDMVSLKRGAGRGLLATLNRGTVKLIGKNTSKTGYYMPAAMAA